VLGLNCCRPLDEQYRGFCGLVAAQVSAALAAAQAYEDERRRAEALAELDRAKTIFFANISHEFRTPLTLIMGPVAELQHRLAGAGPQVREELEVISRNGLRLGKLVTTLLDFSRIQAGRMQASYQPAALAQMTAELASVFRSAIDRAGLAFEVDCPPLPEPVYLDRGMWEKVVLNLLSNALKFTFDGSIRIAVRAGDGQAVVTVADTGTGIPAQEMPRLFERFHRIPNSRARSNEGSGIGLALVRELIQLHGGTITAASTQGEGTTFTIRLPFGHAHLPAGALVPAGQAAAVSATADPFLSEALRWLPGTGPDGDDGTGLRALPEEITPGSDTDPTAQAGRALPARVLVADDNADMREYLARLLRAAGYQVTAVTDGQAALDAVRAGPPDLVISDVMMPRLDGLGLVAALRAEERTAAVPVLLLSARAGQEASIEGLRAGADDYLVKPFTAAELLARARASVELARLRSHHARWRIAMIDALQDAFFVADEDGAVIEINPAFTSITGFGPEGLPYARPQPWELPGDSPVLRRFDAPAVQAIRDDSRGPHSIPLQHRDGHLLWVALSYSEVSDPGTGQKMIVGTFRDITARAPRRAARGGPGRPEPAPVPGRQHGGSHHRSHRGAARAVAYPAGARRHLDQRQPARPGLHPAR
jgi:PAS domain S-box-containing protein